MANRRRKAARRTKRLVLSGERPDKVFVKEGETPTASGTDDSAYRFSVKSLFGAESLAAFSRVEYAVTPSEQVGLEAIIKDGVLDYWRVCRCRCERRRGRRQWRENRQNSLYFHPYRHWH